MHTSLVATDLKGMLEAGDPIQVIDVRSASEFEEGHIPTAINIPLEQVESRLDDLDSRRKTVLVCQSGQRSEMCADLLQSLRSGISILEGGTDAWIGAGLPVVKTSTVRLPLMRQVQIGAGSLIVIGSLLTTLFDSRWILIPFFVGCGLLVAGTTGFCGMAILLRRMPWNQPAKIPAPMTKPNA